MPVECELLRFQPYARISCSECGAEFPEFMRGQVQRSKRFLWVFWKRDYCAIICHECKCVIGYESPQNRD